MSFSPRAHQTDALMQYRRAWTKADAHLGIAPTGSGKTIIAAFIASGLARNRWRTIVVAHREALVVQNADKIVRADPTLKVGIEMASQRTADGPLPDVVSASIATLRGARLAACCSFWRQDGRPIMLITDEAHHAVAASYQRLVEELRPTKHLGITATPFRADGGESLTHLFPEVAFQIDRGALIDGGALAHPHHMLRYSAVSLDDVRATAGDYDEGELVRVLDTDERNLLIMDAADEARRVLAEAHGQPVPRAVCFSLGVAHSKRLAAMFEQNGWEAYAIHGGTPVEDRRHADRRLKRATGPVVLVSCGVLTEGWDVEETNLGLFARPTKSPVLADQMLGRVLRHLADKPRAVVVDFEDADADDRVSIASCFHLPPGWNGHGESLRADELWMQGAIARAPMSHQTRLWACRDRDEVEALLSQAPAEPRLLPGRFFWWDLGYEVRAACAAGSLVLARAPQGDVAAEWRTAVERSVVARGRDLDTVRVRAEAWFADAYPTEARLLSWTDKGHPATEGQLQGLARLGWKGDPATVTRHQAALALNQAKMEANQLAENGRMSFGKYKGRPIAEVPTWYLDWALQGDQATSMRRFLEHPLLEREHERRYGEVRRIEAMAPR